MATYGGNEGSVAISVVGGVQPYAFLWDNGSVADTVTNLEAGTHVVTITDSNGCIKNKPNNTHRAVENW